MKTVLITAYAVNPFKGSEDGTGWNWSYQAAKESKVIVITRNNNIPHIEEYLKTHSDPVHDNMQFVGFDLPDHIMKWKKRLGERGYVAYYYLWQRGLPKFIKEKGLTFDIAHALNFHSDSVPTFLWKLGKPTVWGPIGHHPKVGSDYLSVYNKKDRLRDRVYQLLKKFLRLDPNFRKAVQKVDKIIAINSSVCRAIKADPAKVEIIPAVGSEMIEFKPKENHQTFRFLSVGRAHYMKGFDVVIEAFNHMLDCIPQSRRNSIKLTIVARGEEESRLKSLIAQSKHRSQIEWIDWVDKSEMEALYRSSDVYVFGSHEGAGMVIPEAMSYGLPVVCFDNYGPGELAGDAAMLISPFRRINAIKDFAFNMRELYSNNRLYKIKSDNALSRFSQEFDWNIKGQKIRTIYHNLNTIRMSKSVAVFHPSAELYGADRILVSVLKMLPQEVQKIVYLRFDGDLHEFLQEEVENVVIKKVPQMPVIYRAIFNPVGLVNFVADLFKFYRQLKQDNATYQFENAYVNTLAMSFVLPMLNRLKIKSFTHVHEIIDHPMAVAKLTATFANRFSNQVIAVSNAVKNNLVLNVPAIAHKTSVLHNGISPIPVNGKSPESEKIQFYLFGRIMPAKGQWFLLEALRKIPPHVLAKAQFNLVGGTAPNKEYFLDDLKQKLADYQLAEVVNLVGFTRDISGAMSKADVCLVPSMMKDPFPTTVLEGMSAGKPVIATNHGGAAEAIVDGETGYLVDPTDANLLAQYISSYISSPAQILVHGNQAVNRYKNNYTLSHFEERWMKFFRGINLVEAFPKNGKLFRDKEVAVAEKAA